MARILTITPNPALDLAVHLSELKPGELNRAGSTQLEPAGKGVNVGRVLASLGHSVTVTGFLGEGNEQPFVRALAEWKLQDAFLRVPGETRINIKISESGGRVTDLNGPGLSLEAGAVDRLRVHIGRLLKTAEMVIIAGSLPPGFSPGQLADLVRIARRQQVPVWLDTSGPALAAGVGARPNGIKPNEEELQVLLDQFPETSEERVQAVLRLQAAGPDNILLSAGAEGVTWVEGGAALSARPPLVPVVSTVCAGDTLLAGAVHSILSGWPRDRGLRFATALAAEAVRHVGVGDPHATDFALLEKQTLIHPEIARWDRGEVSL